VHPSLTILKDHSDIVTSRTDAGIRGERTREYDTCVPGAKASVGSMTQEIKQSYTKELTREGIRAILLDLSMAYEPDLSQISGYLKSINPSSDLARVMDAEITPGMTALMLAAAEGNTPVVELLLDCGADPNLSRSDHHTAADLAGDAGYFTISQLLLDKGAEMSLCHLLRRILIERRNGINLNRNSPEHKTEELGIQVSALPPICRAAFDGDVENMRHMFGTDPASYDIEDGAYNGLTPFILASLNCHLEIMDLLLSQGANVNATSNRGWTPLMLAVKRNGIECVRALLTHGADVNHLSPDRWTALAEATNNGFTHLMTLLLQADADTESKSQHDWTPLMHACFRGDLAAVDILLSEGAVVSISSSRDETPMLLAAASGSVAILERLLKEGSAPEPAWSRTNSYSETDDRFEGVGDGSNAGLLERAYQVGWTPLMLACQSGSVEIVRLLLDAGANTQSRSPLLKTALEIAKENGRTDVADFILARSCQRG
jgi:ankyrin repeat domain-containing protein 50